MKNRRSFLTTLSALSGAGLGCMMAASGKAQADSVAVPAPTEKPRKSASAAALALAATYRAFDPHLTDAEVETIAHGIDDNRAAGTKLNPKTKPLRNGDDMAVRFAAAETVLG